MKSPSPARADARGLRVLLLRSTFNAAVVDGLLAGAQEALREMGARARDVTVVEVPGAFELPLAAAASARSRRFDAIVALGAVIKGETDHYEHIARAAAAGLGAGARETGVPVGFGVLTVTEAAQGGGRAVPGAFELPLAAAASARSRRFDAIVALGAVIKGETDHYEHIAREAAAGLGAVARETGIPVGFGVLTVTEEAQARARAAAGPGNKGAEAARAAVVMARVVESLRPRRARKIV